MSAPRNTILTGDALSTLRTLNSASIDCVITSPPYFRLRDYGVAGQLGQEPHVDVWAAGLRAVTRELWRVLKPYGSLYLNLNDAYSTHKRIGAPRKSLLLGPERVARDLLDDGWIIRNKIVWAKPNPLPSFVRDRYTNSHEFVYFAVKQPSAYFDLDAIRVPLKSTGRPSAYGRGTPMSALGALAGSRAGLAKMAAEGRHGHPLGKNPGDVWTIAGARSRYAHFATFPEALVRRPLLASCPEKVCTACGQPWRRSTRQVTYLEGVAQMRPIVPCGCDAPTERGLVLDPFFGTGTVAVVARAERRDWVAIELNPAYAEAARQRLSEAA